MDNPLSWVDPLGLAGDCIDEPVHGAGKSSKQYGHSCNRHGSQNSVQSMQDRARSTKNPQGHLSDNRMIEEAFRKSSNYSGKS